MNARQYAQSRGIDPGTLNKWLHDGKVPSARRNGRLWVIDDPEQADRELQAAKSPDRGGLGGGPNIDGQLRQPTSAAATVPPFAQSRAIRERYAAMILRLEYEQKSAKLVSKDELRLKLSKVHMAVRDALRTIPDRVAPVLASETDQTRIHAVLLKEIGQALEGLKGIDWD